MSRDKNNRFSTNQLHMVLHCLGLNGSGTTKASHRNHYNTGRSIDPEWEELVRLRYADRTDTGSEMGGIYYVMTKKGMKWVQEFYGWFEVMN